MVDPRTGVRGIHFVTNAIDRAPPALAARLTTEGMPMHVLRAASLEREKDGCVTLALDPGKGSGPDGRCALKPAAAPELDPARCEPLVGEVSSRRARAYVGDAKAVCFRVPALRFRYAVERHDRLGG